MNERERKVDGITAAVVKELGAQAESIAHHQECWKRHPYCLAKLIQDILHGGAR